MLREVTLEQALRIYLSNQEAKIQVYSPVCLNLENTELSNPMSVKSLQDVLSFPEGTLILTDAEIPEKKIMKKIIKKTPGTKRTYKRKTGQTDENKLLEENSNEKKKLAVEEKQNAEIAEPVSKYMAKRTQQLDLKTDTSKSSTGRPTTKKNDTEVKIVDDKGKLVDTGKIRALFRAKWSLEDIADEMNIEDDVLLGYMKKMGLFY